MPEMVVATTTPPKFPFQWALPIVVAVVVFVATWMIFRDRAGIRPDDSDVLVSESSVLLKWDDKDAVTEGQKNTINTTKLRTWAESNGYSFRRFDVDDDLSKVEPQWDKLMEVGKKKEGPILILADKEKTKATVCPDSPEKAIEWLEKNK
jgi:hypothetical protein